MRPTSTCVACIAGLLLAGALALGAGATEGRRAEAAEPAAAAGDPDQLDWDAYADGESDDEHAYGDADGDGEDACLRRRGASRTPRWRELTLPRIERPHPFARDAVASHAPRGPPSA